MVVPRLPISVPDLDETNPPFQQPSRDEQLPRLRAWTVTLADMFRFFGDIERFRGVHLHPIRQFKRLDARFHLRVLTAAPGVFLIELAQEVKLLPLLSRRDEFIPDVLDQLLDLLELGIDVGALVNA